MIRKKDDKYWREMTWGWYAVPYPSRERNANKDSYSATDLKVCNDCDRVYSLDTNRGSSKKYKQYNIYQIFVKRI